MFRKGPKARCLPAEQREVRELVYRHGVRPAELPAVLAISADHAQTLLTEAVRSFEQSSWFRADAAEEPGPEVVSWRPGIEQLASVPLASLPDSLLGHTFRAVFDPGAGSHRAAVLTRLGPFGPDGFPRQQTPSVDPPGRRHIIAPLLLGAMLLVLAAAGAAVYYYFSSSPDALARSHSRVLASHPATNPPSPSQAGPHQIRLHHHRTHLKAHSFASAPPPAPSPAPQPSQSSPAPRITKPGPHSSPSPTEHPSPSSTPSSSLSPTPSQSSP